MCARFYWSSTKLVNSDSGLFVVYAAINYSIYYFVILHHLKDDIYQITKEIALYQESFSFQILVLYNINCIFVQSHWCFSTISQMPLYVNKANIYILLLLLCNYLFINVFNINIVSVVLLFSLKPYPRIKTGDLQSSKNKSSSFCENWQLFS